MDSATKMIEELQLDDCGLAAKDSQATEVEVSTLNGSNETTNEPELSELEFLKTTAIDTDDHSQLQSPMNLSECDATVAETGETAGETVEELEEEYQGIYGDQCGNLNVNEASATLAVSTLPSSTFPISTPKELSDSKIGLSLLPEQSKNYALRKGGKFTIMVAGAVGSGKSTFLNTLLGADLLPTTDSEGSGTRNINVNTFNLVEDKFQLLITTIDTPGFGQRFNNQFAWVPISNFIDEQLRLYLFRCEQPERSKVFDTRVHCCIYFIVPTSTGLTPLDILAMKDLSKRVNLIPVVSKGDTLTKEELADFKEIVWSTLQLHDIKVCDLILDQQVTAKINAQMPYSIIASNTYHKNERNELVRGRKYNWGIAEVENNNHCDFLKLREVLMSENMLDLINSTEAQFELYRSRCLKERFDKYFGSEGKSEILEKVNELSGFEELQIYNRTPLSSLESMLRDKDPIMEHAEKKMKEKYAEVISNQEKTFREWKKALVEKQEALNQDIEKDHVLLLKLTAFIDAQTSGESTPEFTVDSISDSEKAPLSRGEIGVEG